MIRGYAASEPGGKLEPFEYDPGPLGGDEVEIEVEFCGLCHSDLSMVDNDWGMSQYPLIPGHEVIGTVAALGAQAKGLALGQRVGLGWHADSCMACEWCRTGNHNLCASAKGTIVGRHGGFAERVRAAAAFVVPVPEGVEAGSAGPLFCGGITVFNPIIQFGVKPTDKVGVVGIGGLGHLALLFLDAWGCEVTAFSSSPEKESEARKLGADHFLNSRDAEALKNAAGTLDFIISTVNVLLDWEAYLAILRPKGRLHLVGAVLQPICLPLFALLPGQKSLSSSPVGAPPTIATMLEFAARHHIRPVVETYPFNQVNEAIEKLREGKARYRIVLARQGNT